MEGEPHVDAVDSSAQTASRLASTLTAFSACNGFNEILHCESGVQNHRVVIKTIQKSETLMPREDDPCKHAYPTRAQCPTCSKASAEDEKPVVVYFTAGGEAYHFDRNCTALEYGQTLVDERDGTRAPIQTAYEHIIKLDRSPCKTCKRKRAS